MTQTVPILPTSKAISELSKKFGIYHVAIEEAFATTMMYRSTEQRLMVDDVQLRILLARAEAERDSLRSDLYERSELVTGNNFDEMQQRAERAEATIAELKDKLGSINRITSPGNRTLDDFMRDMGYACDIARAAIARATGKESNELS